MPLCSPKLLTLVVPPLATLVASRAHAGPTDPETLRDELEERVIERDADAADLALGATPVDTIGGARSSLYLSLGGFAGRRDDGRSEVAGMLVLGVPLDRFAAPRRVVVADEPLERLRPDDALDGVALAPIADGPSPAVAPAPAPHAPFEVAVSAAVARACVQAAYRAHGLAGDERTDSLAARSRASAALPELRLRAVRTTNESASLSPTQYDPYRYTEGGTTGHWYEARMTWHLDRLVFADEEVAIERVRMERAAARSKLAARVLQALFEWQRAHALELDPLLASQEHLAAVLRALEAEATLDVLTDGWFGRWRADAAD